MAKLAEKLKVTPIWHKRLLRIDLFSKLFKIRLRRTAFAIFRNVILRLKELLSGKLIFPWCNYDKSLKNQEVV